MSTKKEEKKAEQIAKSVWYKTWWGVLIVVFLILPYFLIWQVWKKTKWKQSSKIAVSALIILVFFWWLLPFDYSGTSKTIQSPTTTQTIEAKREESKAPQFVFDVPSLIGKNIDEVRKVLGEPIDKEYTEPTEQQKELGMGKNQWDNTFRKGEEELLVTFDPNSRKIIDFFISAFDQDKTVLLEKGNLKADTPEYKLEYVKAIKDPSKITGVKIIPR